MVRESAPPTAVDWLAPEPPANLIFDDGEPLESLRHHLAMNVLIRSLLAERLRQLGEDPDQD